MKADWATLGPRDQVKGNDGHTWIVVSLDDRPGGAFEATLTRDGRKPFTGLVSGQVEVVWSAAMEMDKAQALMQVTLGAEVSGRKGPNGVWLTPSGFSDPGSLLAHGYIFHHSVGPGDATLRELIAWHDELHSADGMQPHHHDPDFYKVNR